MPREDVIFFLRHMLPNLSSKAQVKLADNWVISSQTVGDFGDKRYFAALVLPGECSTGIGLQSIFRGRWLA